LRRTPRMVVLRMDLERGWDTRFRRRPDMMMDFLNDAFRGRRWIDSRNPGGRQGLILTEPQSAPATRCYPARARSTPRSTVVPHAGHLS
jgi:hypothetical protein